MKVSGFTFIRNALIYDYPIVEAIRSILPLCDEVVVAVGQSEDATLELIQSIDPSKIRIIETQWDDTLREGGRVLAVETDKAFAAISKDSDWAFYIQGDEVIHEEDLPAIQLAMQENLSRTEVDGLLFHYRHFYGSYDYVGDSLNWYPKEIRIIRNNPEIYSYRDAQGFRMRQDDKLKVVQIPAYVNHYGWVKEPEAMQKKQETFNKLWHDDQWVETHVVKAAEFDYAAHVRSLKRFTGTHPKVMQERIARKNWSFEHDPSFNRSSVKDRVKRFLSQYLGLDFSYKNYELLPSKR
ncbi:MAG: glycosyltransferase family 2 protein [Bacteroidota bacterium]|nr:glycosyltransferase family 2 protein [Bacteroidota bacterium]MDX5430987.1 glycosyltransferase family 2 protein [Bacteroidota bacterium]MDX5469738.1 glycosyltransferase family 2 protein [Bacteroidota bacterium]